MKSIKYILGIALCSLVFASCQDGDNLKGEWDVPTIGDAPYGNNAIQETNVLTIAQLKTKFNKAITANYRQPDSQISFEEVKEDLQIKAIVTANDVSGNLYKEIALQDATGAILVRISCGNLWPILPIGTEIIVDLKGLYVGNYRMQPSIGMPSSVSSGNYKGYAQLGYIANTTWEQHYKITGNKGTVEPIEFDASWGKAEALTQGGKLVKLTNVSFKRGSYYDNDKSTNIDIPFNADAKFADPAFNNSVSWYFNELNDNNSNGTANVMLYNSNYAKFASEKLPQGKVNITGILKFYSTNPDRYPSWEVCMRTRDDLQ